MYLIDTKQAQYSILAVF